VQDAGELVASVDLLDRLGYPVAMPDTLRAPDRPIERARGMARALVRAVRETPAKLRHVYGQVPASRRPGEVAHDAMTEVSSTMERGARGLRRVVEQVRQAAR